MIGIYKITNLLNGKIYIGQSVDIWKRISEHKWRALNKGDNSYNCAIHRAFRKYGIENFKFEIIEETDEKSLDEKEIFYIKFFNSLCPNGYNIKKGGQRKESYIYKDITDKPKYFCKQCGKQVTNSKSGLCVSCFNKSRAIKNRPSKEELKDMIMSLPFTEIARIYKVSDNTIRKWCKLYDLPYKSKELFPKKEEKEAIDLRKPIAKIDPNTEEVIEVFQSCSEAARSLGLKSNSHIVEACKGKIKKAYGYKWRYV